MGQGTLDIDTLRRWVGSSQTTHDVLSPDLVRKFRATFDQPAGDPQPGEPAPLLIHFCLGQPSALTQDLSEDGHPHRGGFLPPVALPRRMWAGGAMRFSSPLCVGDIVERHSRVTDVALKDGRSGSLCFVTVEHEITVGKEVRLKERQDVVFREAAATGATPIAATAPAEPSEHQREIDPSVALLFRYSALTFNAHRIHYDRPYATGVETYPGLIVHGPLQATWLAAFAAEIGGKLPKEFSFRSQVPLFDDAPLILHARQDGNGLALWTARPGGPKAMVAEARW